MPAIRPEAISNRIRLTYKVRAATCFLVAEGGAVDAVLPLTGSDVDAVIFELPPDEAVSVFCEPPVRHVTVSAPP